MGNNDVNDENLKKVQQISLKCLRKVAEVCEKHNITYYLDSGALIGAIRHQSLIPWDDDIDVAFRREDYYKLLQVPKEDWGEDFALVTYRELTEERSFLDFTTRVIYLKEDAPVNTFEKAAECCVERYRNCVPLDCFILDEAFDSKMRQKLLVFKLVVLYGLAMGHRTNLDLAEYSGRAKMIVKVLAALGRKIPLSKIYCQYEKISQSAPKCGKKVFYSNYPVNWLNVVCDKSWYDGTVKVPINLEHFDAPKGYHEVLTTIYGDYMTPPAEEDRVAVHMK